MAGERGEERQNLEACEGALAQEQLRPSRHRARGAEQLAWHVSLPFKERGIRQASSLNFFA